ncbi:DUF1064 domain-containing protein [Listeria rocourtiae]|uniref:DUF1064 domain-containing protein n=1 Tax=Listeria rocourtiae TaxID=647910 RepID=UPI0003E88861|nr:hypothetical protein PROCOU_01542 [Listeria rocourtiae FSL F6-920]
MRALNSNLGIYCKKDSEKTARVIKKIEYVADFEVLYADGHTEIIDIKGVKTEAFKLKQKLFERKYMDSIKCLKLEGRGFVEV